MKVAILKINGKPFGICEVKDVDSFNVAKVQKEIEENVADQEKKIAWLEQQVNELNDLIGALKQEIKVLKGED